jgi:hypothetical protein
MIVVMMTTLIMIRMAITVTKAKRAVSFLRSGGRQFWQLVGSLDGLIHFDKWTMRFAPST